MLRCEHSSRVGYETSFTRDTGAGAPLPGPRVHTPTEPGQYFSSRRRVGCLRRRAPGSADRRGRAGDDLAVASARCGRIAEQRRGCFRSPPSLRPRPMVRSCRSKPLVGALKQMEHHHGYFRNSQPHHAQGQQGRKQSAPRSRSAERPLT